MTPIDRHSKWEVHAEDCQVYAWVGGYVDEEFEAFHNGDEKRLRRELTRLKERLLERGVSVRYIRPMWGPWVSITPELQEALS
jgi:hypothetical protein